MDEESFEVDKPGHRSAATVAGLQFVLGIGMALGLLIPALIFYFVLLPMGWGAILPTVIMVFALALIGRIGWVMTRGGKK